MKILPILRLLKPRLCQKHVMANLQKLWKGDKWTLPELRMSPDKKLSFFVVFFCKKELKEKPGSCHNRIWMYFRMCLGSYWGGDLYCATVEWESSEKKQTNKIIWLTLTQKWSWLYRRALIYSRKCWRRSQGRTYWVLNNSSYRWRLGAVFLNWIPALLHEETNVEPQQRLSLLAFNCIHDWLWQVFHQTQQCIAIKWDSVMAARCCSFAAIFPHSLPDGSAS